MDEILYENLISKAILFETFELESENIVLIINYVTAKIYKIS